MGGQNVLSGRVRSIDDRKRAPSGPSSNAMWVPLQGKSRPVDSLVHFAVRRDLVDLRREVPGKLHENSLHVSVDTVEYQGIYFKITVSPVAGEEFIAIEPETRFFAHPVAFGDRAMASWRTEEAHLLEPDTEAGGGAQPYAEDSTG